MGKAGLVGQKIMATLASTGTPSHCLHPAEAVHGDLGRVHRDDVMLILSQSGETEEIVRLLPSLAELGVPIVAITGRAASTLGRAATVTIELGPLEEACPLGLAPSTSTTAMLAVGDALALVVSQMRRFQPRGFRPLPSGRQPGPQAEQGGTPHAAAGAVPRGRRQQQTIREVLDRAPACRAGAPGPRCSSTSRASSRASSPTAIWPGCSSIAATASWTRPIRQVMTQNPLRVEIGSMMVDAVAIMAGRKISELPVVDAEGKPVGLIDITDVVALLPQGGRGRRSRLDLPAQTGRLARCRRTRRRTQCVDEL